MIRHAAPAPRTVIGPLGERMRACDLPSPETSRWVARRKAEVVIAAAGGLLSEREACDRYHLSLEELAAWRCALEREGLSGLKARSVQENRRGHALHRRSKLAETPL